jgi:hypothetical protein
MNETDAQWEARVAAEDKKIRDRIVAVMDKYTKAMDSYNGITEIDYEDVADAIMAEFKMGAM